MATVLSIAPLPPSSSPIHPINPPTPPTSTTPIFKFSTAIASRPTTPTSIHSTPDTPPASPSDDTSSIESNDSSLTLPSEPPSPSYILFPPTNHELIRRERANIYAISASTLAQAYHEIQTQPLPPAADLFPWLHGLNPRNAGQLCFFSAQSPGARVPPIHLGYRTLTIVHVPAPFGCYRPGRLVGAINYSEILGRSLRDGHFADMDPIKGICLRNFQIQTAKMAMLSDIVVYSPRGGQNKDVLDVAEKIAHAQRFVRMKHSTNQHGIPQYNTFVVNDDLETFELNHSELVAVDSCGRTTDYKIDFLTQEREEMRRLTTATKISDNVYLGNSADAFSSVIEYVTTDNRVASKGFDICIETKDMAEITSAATLKDAEAFLNGGGAIDGRGKWFARSLTRPLSLEFPSSTPPLMARHDPEAIVTFCEWMYHITHSQTDSEDTVMSDDSNPSTSGRTMLIHCQDGYTESTFLALSYLMFVNGIPAHEAWVRLHTTLQRSFFAFESDLQALKYLQPFLLERSPASPPLNHNPTPAATPAWFTNLAFDGSFPSRILPHMYLGNLQHANNPEMLRTLGITRVLSIGEEVLWDVEKEKAAGMKLLYLDNVQDNGIDPLLDSIDPCLDYLGTLRPHLSLYYRGTNCVDAGYCAGEKTLVHCRVGVSRSASICIAEVMRRARLSLPRAYLFVRARRLNVIIQPNLRFMYELMKWEELEFARLVDRMKDATAMAEYGKKAAVYKREMEWAWLCKEIADLNKTYTSTS